MWRFKRKSIGKYFFAFHFFLRQVLRLHVAQTGLELNAGIKGMIHKTLTPKNIP